MSGIFAESAEELEALEDFRSGSLGVKIKKLSKKIESLLVEVESQLDFSDEDGVSSVDKKMYQLICFCCQKKHVL